jgi:hypothetical protein
MAQNIPVYAQPHLYIQGLNISYASSTILAIAPGAARDSNNNIDILVGYPETDQTQNVQFANYTPPILINSAVNGYNGLDYGVLAASTQYAVYLIADSRQYNPVGAMISLTSNVSPLMPLGYDSFRLIGFAATYTGTTWFNYSDNKPQNMVGFLQYFNQPAISVLSGGNATTFTAIDLTANSAMPTTTLENTIVEFLVTFTPAAAGDIVEFRPTGSSATANLVTITGIQAGIAQSQYIQVIAGVGSSKPEVDYLVTSSSDAVSVSVASWGGVSNTAYPALV